MARGRPSAWVFVLAPTAREPLESGPRATTMAAGLGRRGQRRLRLADRLSPSPVAPLAGGQRGVLPPEVASPVVRLACERPDPRGRRLAPWDGPARARPLLAAGIVAAISAAPVRRLLAAPQRQPGRQQVWRSPKPPRDAAFD